MKVFPQGVLVYGTPFFLLQTVLQDVNLLVSELIINLSFGEGDEKFSSIRAFISIV